MNPEDVCVRCRLKLKAHIPVNWSEENRISATVYVCPSAVFMSVEEFVKQHTRRKG